MDSAMHPAASWYFVDRIPGILVLDTVTEDGVCEAAVKAGNEDAFSWTVRLGR